MVEFTINVTNNGPSNATGVNITDRLDSAFEFMDNLNPDAVYENGVVTWTINKINVNESASVVLKVRVIKEGNFSNVASVVSHENGTETNGSSENVTAGTVILNITKSANASTVNVGDVVRFNITVNNTGSANATGVNITDSLNSTFEFVNASNNVKAVNNVVVWKNLNIVNGTSVTVWVEVRVKANGTFTNVATAKANENKTTFENETNITVKPVVNLTVVKSSDVVGNASVGDLVNYTITVTNNGPSNATMVNITDKLDDTFEFINSTGNIRPVNGVITWNISKIVNGTSVSVWVQVRVTMNGTFTNVAVAKAKENDTEFNNETNITVKPVTNLDIVKSSNASYGKNVSVGDLVEFTITVINKGSSNATNINITDELDSAFGFYNATGNYTRNNQIIVWDIGKLNKGENVTVHVIVVANNNGYYENVAVVNSTENPTGNSSKTIVVIEPAVNITMIKKSNLTDNAHVGDLVNFTIEITNMGPSKATGVNITDSLPNGLVYVDSGNNITGNKGKYSKIDGIESVEWNIGNLTKGSKALVWVVVNVTTNGTFTNVAGVTSNENKTGTSNETNITVDPVVNLTVVKYSDVIGNASVGDLVNFTIVVTNNGPSNATMVNITDELNSAFEFVNASGNAKSDENNVVKWIIPKIVGGNSTSVWVQVRVKANGTFTNVAVAKAKENDTEFNNETNITVDPVVNLTVNKTVNATNVIVGDLVKFTINVTNNGPSNATMVNIADKLDSAFEFVAELNPDANCAGGIVTWTINKINVNESASVDLIVRVVKEGNFSNVASVVCHENDTETNGSSENVTAGTVILNITKSANASVVNVGDVVRFNITVNNTGSANATGVNVTDVLNPVFEFVNASGNVKADVNNVVVWNNLNIVNGTSVTVWVEVRVKTNGTFTNVATAKANENNSSFDNKTNITVNPVVNLTVIKSSDVVGNASVGDLVNYTITVTNNGPSNATMVNITDKLDDTFEFINASGGVSPVDGVITWNISKIVNGTSVSVWVQVRVTMNGTFTNVAVVKAKENDTEFNNETNITVDPVVNLAVNKTVNATNVIVGDLVEFTINVTNNGPSNATGVNITDRLDSAFEFIADLNPDASYADGVVSWNIDKINVNETASVVLTVRVVKEGNFSNVAFAKSNENDTETNGSSENVTAGTVILNITKSANASVVNVGDVVRFDITVNNTGSANATGVNVTDVLNPVFEFVNASGNAKADVNNVVVWNNLNILNGTSVTIWVEVRVKTNGTFTNVAAATANENKTTFDNKTNITVNPVVNLTVVKHSDVIGNASVGDLVNFTIVVTNNGPSNATMVNITDELNSAFEFVNASGNAKADENNVVKWIIPKIVSGNSTSVWVQVRVKANGTFTNVAVVKSKENSTPSENGTNVTVDPVVNLSVNKTVNATNVIVGDLVEFTINVTNNGPSNATGVNITDRLDSAFEFIADLNPDASYADGVVSWNIDKINVNETASVVLTVRVVKEGNFSNVAFAKSNENDTETNGSSENVTAGTVVLNVTKIANASVVNVGDVVRFNITVNNTGSANATGVNVTDLLNPAFEFVNASDNAQFVNNVVIWNIDKIVSSNSTSVWVEVRVKTNGTFTNVATATANENKTTSENGTNITVNPIVDLSIIKNVSATNVTIGDEIIYTIVVVNNGPSNATNINVTENLKGNVEFINVNASKGDYDKSTGIWTVGTLNYNETVTLILTVKVLSEETIENSVYVNSTENDTKPGDNNYTSENVTVNKAPSFVSAEDVNVTYGEAIIIPVTSENATGVIYQIISPEGKVVANGTIDVGENITGLDLPAGDYVVNLTTMVDVNHTVASNTSKLTVNKAVPPMDITPVNITYGDNETIIIELPENATGTVNITVGNKTFVDIPVENGTVNITVPDLPAGNYTVNVTYSGNENYTSTNGSEPFNVKKVDTPIDLQTQDIFYGDEEVIVVTLPEDVTGTVNITVGDKTYENVPVNNGKVELPIDDLGGGTYPVEVVYGGDNNHNANSTTGSFVVSPVKPVITIEVEDIWVGEVEILNVTVNAPGYVNITVNGITVTVSLENGVVTTDVLAAGTHEDYNGRATWNIINLPVGLYPAFAIYGGNENYTSVNTSDVFRVRALPSSLDITTHDIYVGEDESIQVLVNYTDATGNITITVDGRNYTSPVENGKAQFTIPGLKAGEYDVEAYYSGDDKYLPSNATGDFKVSKLTPTVNTEAPDIKVGEDGVITVTVPGDATGTITIVVEGKEYTATIENGKAIFVVPGLSEGTHEIKVYYSGDDKYNPIDGIGSIKVLPLDENKTSPDVSPSKGIDLTSYPTGNPILIILLVMMLIGSTAVRRFKK